MSMPTIKSSLLAFCMGFAEHIIYSYLWFSFIHISIQSPIQRLLNHISEKICFPCLACFSSIIIYGIIRSNFDWFLHVRMPNFPRLILQSFLGFMHIYRTCMFYSHCIFNLSVNLSSYRLFPFVQDATKLGKKVSVQVNVTSPSDGVINPSQERLLFQMK